MNNLVCLVLLGYTAIVSGYDNRANLLSYEKPVTTVDIKELRKDLFVTRGYDKYARPIPAKDQLRVDIQYSLIKLRKVDLKSQSMTVDGWLWYQWHDEGLVWNTNQKFSHIKSIRVPSDQIYTPDIMVYNGIDFTTKKSVLTHTIVSSIGLIIWVPPVTTQALCHVDLRKWPYDQHICFLKFGSWTHDGLIMDVKAMNQSRRTVLSDMYPNPEFDVEFLNVTETVKYYDCCKEPYPSVTFYFQLQRKPTLYHYIVSVPAVVAIILSLITFWFPIRSNIRFVLNGISLLTLTLLLIHLGSELGFSSLGVPAGVRFLSLTTLLIGILQIWFTIGYNISLVKSKIPLWTIKMSKPLLQIYKNTDNEANHLTQTVETPDVSKKSSSSPTAEDLTFVFDKIVFVVYGLTLAIISYI